MTDTNKVRNVLARFGLDPGQPLENSEVRVLWAVRTTEGGLDVCGSEDIARKYAARHVGYTVVSRIHVEFDTEWSPNMHLLAT